MALLTPPPTAPQRGNRSTFSTLLDAFVTWLVNFVTEMTALVAGLNVLAAGGAYTIPYTFSTTTTDADPGAGFLRLDNLTQGSATVIRADILGTDGKDWSALLDNIQTSTSATKGSIKLTKLGDPSKWIVFDVTAVASPTGYRNITCTVKSISGANPFTNGDALIMQIQRTGDKGDTAVYSAPVMYVRDEKATNNPGGSILSATWTTRTLNTVKVNNISGAALASNQITLVGPGTFEIFASAPAWASNGHQIRLLNVTDSTVVEYGTTEYASSSDTSESRSILRCVITLATVTKAYALQHWLSFGNNGSGGALGMQANTGGVEVYSEVWIKKVA